MSTTRDQAVVRRPLPWLGRAVVIASFLISFLILGGTLRFGTIASTLAYLNGDRLFLDSPSKAVGIVVEGLDKEVEFRLKNAGSSPIRLVGARSTCSCVFSDEFPIDVPAGGSQRLRVGVRTQGKVGPVSESMQFYTDSPRQPVLNVKVTGTVIVADR
ncbi:MAG: DUF1573 domain-containing protein [Planctomycetota bacterium]|nr:DUF1573 domain-containing protein [Planctomycetota bacterium]